MKSFLLIQTLLITLVSRATPTSPIDYIYIEPYKLNEKPLLVAKTNTNSVQLTVTLKVPTSSSTKTILKTTISKAGVSTFNLNNSYLSNNATISVSYTVGTNKKSSSYYQMEMVNNFAEEIEGNTTITSRSNLMVFDKNLNYRTQRLQYTFNGFEGIYVPDYFQKIDLTEFKIYVDTKYESVFSCTPILYITNVNGCFDRITNASNLVQFPLKLTKVNDYFTFTLQNKLYVNRDTLIMSTNKAPNSVLTRHIYLPINEFYNQDKYHATLELNAFGIDKTYVYHEFDLHAMKNTLGDCSNSQYCIIKS